MGSQGSISEMKLKIRLGIHGQTSLSDWFNPFDTLKEEGGGHIPLYSLGGTIFIDLMKFFLYGPMGTPQKV